MPLPRRCGPRIQYVRALEVREAVTTMKFLAFMLGSEEYDIDIQKMYELPRV